MTKKLTFEQVFGYCRHIYSSEKLFFTLTQIVYSTCHQFLTSTTFTQNKNRCIGRLSYHTHLIFNIRDNFRGTNNFNSKFTFHNLLQLAVFILL